MRLYVYQYTDTEIRRYIRQGRAPCCNIAHGLNPPIVDFNENSAALDSLIRRNWCVCGACYQRYLRNGHTQIIIVDRRTRLPAVYRA